MEFQITQDALFRGKVRLWQPAKGFGYRFNMDSVFLAHFARPGKRGVDLGAGCGVIGILMCYANKLEALACIERQPEMADLCRRNLGENELEGVARVVETDLRDLPSLRADTVVFNPPYFAVGSGRGSPNEGRDQGRFERHGTAGDFLRAASAIVDPKGSVSLIIRAERYDEILASASGCKLEPRTERFILSRVGDRPRNVLLELVPNGAARVERLPDLIVHRGAGRAYTAEVKAIFEESKSWTMVQS